MELRDFFTEDEVKEMKERIIKETASYAFLMDEQGNDKEDGPYLIKTLRRDIDRAVRDEADILLKEYVKEVINTTVKERIADAAKNFTERLVDQLNKITEKTNWYWSIK